MSQTVAVCGGVTEREMPLKVCHSLIFCPNTVVLYWQFYSLECGNYFCSYFIKV